MPNCQVCRSHLGSVCWWTYRREVFVFFPQGAVATPRQPRRVVRPQSFRIGRHGSSPAMKVQLEVLFDGAGGSRNRVDLSTSLIGSEGCTQPVS